MALTVQQNRLRKTGMILFLVGQIVLVAHTTAHGAGPHEHDGVACLATLTDEYDGLIPAASPAVPPSSGEVSCPAAATGHAPSGLLRALLPPPTGPPSI